MYKKLNIYIYYFYISFQYYVSIYIFRIQLMKMHNRLIFYLQIGLKTRLTSYSICMTKNWFYWMLPMLAIAFCWIYMYFNFQIFICIIFKRYWCLFVISSPPSYIMYHPTTTWLSVVLYFLYSVITFSNYGK